MTFLQYKTEKHEYLMAIWLDSACFQYLTFNAFAKDMYRKYWEDEEGI
ncbi:hypothetical protein pA_gene0075 [Vibrio phage 13VT501A]|nr:hypothetical protein pA_gene0075 [Vibrio phage 13VT501A]